MYLRIVDSDDKRVFWSCIAVLIFFALMSYAMFVRQPELQRARAMTDSIANLPK